MPELSDKWAAGATYEHFMGRWSRLLAPRFVSWLSVRPTANWLDVGCGTGALADSICDGANPAAVVACDPSGPFIEYARQRQAHRIGLCIGLGAECGRGAGEYFAVGRKLRVHFQADDDLPCHVKPPAAPGCASRSPVGIGAGR